MGLGWAYALFRTALPSGRVPDLAVRAVAAGLGIVLTAAVLTVTAAGDRGAESLALSADLGQTPPLSRPVEAEALVAPSPVPAPAQVRPLKALRRPDLLLTLRRPLTAAQAQRLRDTRGVEGLTVADLGTVQVGGRGARVLGVDPSQLRQFTPQVTAQSDPLWAAVARGELVTTYALMKDRGLRLGTTTRVTGREGRDLRVGGVAALGLPQVELVTDRAATRALGVMRDSAVVLDAPSRSVSALTRDVRRVVGDDAGVTVLRDEPKRASRGRPATYRELYIQSARLCPGLRWQVLAAVGEVESGHGRNNGPSSAGALGPMQFLPSTWKAYGVDGDGDGKADIWSAFDAVPSAALYLCRNGAGQGPEGLYNALFAYNHLDSYVRKVLAVSERYR